MTEPASIPAPEVGGLEGLPVFSDCRFYVGAVAPDQRVTLTLLRETAAPAPLAACIAFAAYQITPQNLHTLRLLLSLEGFQRYRGAGFEWRLALHTSKGREVVTIREDVGAVFYVRRPSFRSLLGR